LQKVKRLAESKIVVLLMLFSFVLGTQYIFFTPPWQAPDEITHYEYIDILSRAKIFEIKQKPDHNLQKEIIKSMDQFNAWKYVFRERPSPLPEEFDACPLYGASGSKIDRPPLYYILSSFVLKIFKIDNLLLKHYFIRLFSLFLSLFTILFVFLAAKMVFNNDFYYSFTAACLVAFLPQFMIISGSINSDSLANMISAFSIFVFLFSLKNMKNYYILLLFPLLIILGLLTGKTAFFIVPSLFIFSVIYVIKTWKGKDKKFGVSLFTLASISIFIIIYFLFRYIFPDLLIRVTANVLPVLKNYGQLFKSNFYAEFNPHFVEMLFRSYWYYAGWMAFPFPDYIYNILKIFPLLGIMGLIKYVISKAFRAEKKFPIQLDQFILLVSFCFLAVFGLVIRLGFTIEPMARYFFPALSAFAILFVIGMKELIPFKSRKIVLMSIIFLFIVLNIYAIFHHLINVFYFYFW
jgi:4-amino-4-deoxy-L-arabinose transferase-like glycosyltransferase